MKRARRAGAVEPRSSEAIVARARVGRRTKHLIFRIQPGEIAIVDHEDMDRLSAEGLAQRQVAAVVNASRSSTGRYPNLGPLMLRTAGIPLIDAVGPGIMSVEDGTEITIDGDRIYRSDNGQSVEIARGRLITLEAAERSIDTAKQTIATELERFAENTIGYIKDEREVLLEAARLPAVTTEFDGRHVLIVVRGYDHRHDLAALSAYIREVRPLLVGVDGGADALLEAGLKPDMIIGDMDSVTTEALLSGAELVVHAYPTGEAPGMERIEALGLDAIVYQATGTSEDIAMLLAYERGAELIVAVGTHANLVEFLDKGRKGMASTFLVRLRVGPILVDAKGVSRIYRGRVRRGDLLLLICAALLTMAIVVALSKPVRLELSAIFQQLGNLWFAIKRAIFS